MIKKNKKEYKKIIKEIKKAENIVIFRHELPDFDALGSQFGLYYWLMNNFPTKHVFLAGKNHVKFTPKLYPVIEEIDDDDFPKDFLAIVCDTANEKRIDDKRFKNAKMIVKFDHHPFADDYANIQIINEELSSCAELIADFMFFNKRKYPISRCVAKYLFSGIVGDSGRFLFSSVSKHTFDTVSKLMDTGLDISKDVYLKMYSKTYQDLLVTKYILNNTIFTDNGVAYYVLKEQDLNDLNITKERGKENLSMLRDLENIEVCFSVTEDVVDNNYRISIRSKRIPINHIAEKYDGGGHELASGAKLNSLDNLPELVNDLEIHIQQELKKMKTF